MKSFSLYKFSTFFLLLLVSCDMDFRSEQEIIELINSKKDKLIFLSFWDGMDHQDFERVKKVETKNKNLVNGKFEFMLNSTKKVPFSVNLSYDNHIELTYRDEHWLDYEGSGMLTPDMKNEASIKGMEYERIIDVLIRTLNNQYELIKSNYEIKKSGFRNPDYYTYDYVWKSNKENTESYVVILDTYHSYFQPYSAFHRDKEKKRDKIASCRLTITYMSSENYAEQLKRNQEYKKEKEKEKLDERKREMKKIKDNLKKIDENREKL